MKVKGNGTVEKRAKGKWRLRVTIEMPDGSSKRLNRTVERRTKTEAKAALSEWAHELRMKTGDCEHEYLTVAECLNGYVDHLALAGSKSPTTIDGYRGIVRLRYEGTDLGNTALGDLNRGIIESHLSDMLAHGGRDGTPLNVETVKRAYSLLSGALKREVFLGHIPYNYAEGMRPGGSSKFEGKPLTPEEAREMLAKLRGHPDKRFAAAAELKLATGMRRSEICGLVWEDVDFGRQAVHVCHDLVEVRSGSAEHGRTYTLKRVNTKTVKSNRWITIDDLTLDWLKTFYVEQTFALNYTDTEMNAQTPVFCDVLGRWYKPNHFSKDFRQFADAMGLSNRLHDLRHTQATLSLQSLEDLIPLSRRLGHSKVSTTLDIYGHLLPGQDRMIADKIGQVLAGRTA